MTDMDIKENALVEDIATLGKIYCDCRSAGNDICRNGDWNAVKSSALKALNFASYYAAEEIHRKINDYAADLNAGGTGNDNA